MNPTFFDYLIIFNEFFMNEFNLETSLFEKNVNHFRLMYEDTTSTRIPKELQPSKIFAAINTRTNLNYLIGSYHSLSNGLPSYSLMGMRVVLESITRGYYYLCEENSACVSYLYILNQMKDVPIDSKDIIILKSIIKNVDHPDIVKIAETNLKNERLSDAEMRELNKLDKSSREFKLIINKIYTKTRQKKLRQIWAVLSRYAHGGTLGRYKDLSYRDEDRGYYQELLNTLLLLLSGNIIFFIESFYPYIILKSKYFVSIFEYLNSYPMFTPNKSKYSDSFNFNSAELFRSNYLGYKV